MLAVASSKPDVPDAVCTVLELLIMGGEPPETWRVLAIIKNIV
jgi:hypothetical protein